jgi:putative transposase
LGTDKPSKGVLTLSELEQRFRDWLLDDYHRRVQKGQSKGPQERWEEEGFLPRMPESLEQLDLLLVQVARKRRVQQSGIAFEGHAYIDPTLAAYVGEEVMIRYDPLDLAEIRVFFEDRFVSRAICPELSGQTVSLKEIVAARQAQRRQLREEIVEREALVKRYGKTTKKAGGTVSREPGMEQGNGGGESDAPGQQREQKEEAPSTKRLKRYRHE